MPKIEVYSELPNTVLDIEYDGEMYMLRQHVGKWELFNSSGERVAYIGRRERWTSALSSALERLTDHTLVQS